MTYKEDMNFETCLCETGKVVVLVHVMSSNVCCLLKYFINLLFSFLKIFFFFF